MSWITTPESSTVAGFGYTNDRRVLTIEFKNGGKYNYFDVPEAVFEQLKNSASKGQFLASNIKNVYRYARV